MLEFIEDVKKEIPVDDSASEGEKMLLYWLIRETKPEVVVETGTHRGLSGTYLAHALHDNKKGHLHTADPFDWGQHGNFRKFPELEKRITFYNERGEDMIKKLDKIDFAFIDGFHEDFEVIPEIEALIPKLSKRAVVVFHDCWYGDTAGVNEAVEKAGLKSVWIPTKNAIRIYTKHEAKPKG